MDQQAIFNDRFLKESWPGNEKIESCGHEVLHKLWLVPSKFINKYIISVSSEEMAKVSIELNQTVLPKIT